MVFVKSHRIRKFQVRRLRPVSHHVTTRCSVNTVLVSFFIRGMCLLMYTKDLQQLWQKYARKKHICLKIVVRMYISKKHNSVFVFWWLLWTFVGGSVIHVNGLESLKDFYLTWEWLHISTAGFLSIGKICFNLLCVHVLMQMTTMMMMENLEHLQRTATCMSAWNTSTQTLTK